VLMIEFSVLMSVYIKENAEFLDKALESVLINQKLTPTELVLVEDGPLTDELYSCIEKYKSRFGSKLKVVKLVHNKGLGEALNIGLQHCSNEIIARMDSDDIAHQDRFKIQINYLKDHPEITVLGSNIIEFVDELNDTRQIKKIPIEPEEIVNFSKRRNPLNHMTVCFRKKEIQSCGGYQHLPYLEDYYLWVRMIQSGHILKNLDSPLVYMRTGKDMLKRRSNKQQISSWYILQKYMLRYNRINLFGFLLNMVNICGFVFLPMGLKKIVYEKILRSKQLEF